MAKRPGKRFGGRFWITALLSFPLLVACLSYLWLFWPLLDLLSIGAPFLLAWNFLLSLYWAWRRTYHFLIPLVALLFALFVFEPVYKLGNTGEEISEGLKLLSYNTRNYYESTPGRSDESTDDFYSFLEAENADILCLQEVSMSALQRIKGYPYRHSTPRGSSYAGQAILSNYPMIATGNMRFPDSRNNTLYADLVMGLDTIRIYNVHLESYKISSRRFVYEDYGTPFLQRMRQVALLHQEQVTAVKAHQQSSPYPALISGDFNVTAFSNAYGQMKRGMRDTFSEVGQGLGSTYSLKGIPYRIDYILSDPAIQVIDHKTYEVGFSDHLPISAILRLPGH